MQTPNRLVAPGMVPPIDEDELDCDMCAIRDEDICAICEDNRPSATISTTDPLPSEACT
jgi:hypothetical protein